MIVDLPLDIGQKVYIVANKAKMNSAGRIYPTKEKVIYPATVIGFLLEREDEELCVKAKVLIETDVIAPSNRPYSYMDEVKDSECFQDEASAMATLGESA